MKQFNSPLFPFSIYASNESLIQCDVSSMKFRRSSTLKYYIYSCSYYKAPPPYLSGACSYIFKNCLGLCWPASTVFYDISSHKKADLSPARHCLTVVLNDLDATSVWETFDYCHRKFRSCVTQGYQFISEDEK